MIGECHIGGGQTFLARIDGEFGVVELALPVVVLALGVAQSALGLLSALEYNEWARINTNDFTGKTDESNRFQRLEAMELSEQQGNWTPSSN